MRLILAFILVALAGPGWARVPRVVTDFTPVQSLVMQVMGSLGAPRMLMPVGADPHEFQLRPSQARALQSADIVFWVGPELMPALDEAMTAMAAGARSVALLHDGGGHIRTFADGEGPDPHAWLDPTNAEAWLTVIAAELGRADPQNAPTYAANAAAARASIAALDARLKARLAPARGLPIVFFHDAMGYFATHYGLRVAGTIELGDASAPGAAHLAALRDLLRRIGAACLFPEAGRDPKFIATLAAGSSVRIGAALDPIGLTMDPGPGAYAAILQGLADSIASCAAR